MLKHLDLVYFPLFSQFANAEVYKEGYCMWYGQCGDGENGGKLNCYYNKPAVLVQKNSTFFDKIVKLCPSVINQDNPSNTKVCCDINQLNTLDKAISVPRQALARCPACLYNFIDIFCRTTCSPDGSTFQQPVVINGTDGVEEVKSITMYLDPSTINDLFTSCKDVNFPQTNTKVYSMVY